MFLEQELHEFTGGYRRLSAQLSALSAFDFCEPAPLALIAVAVPQALGQEVAQKVITKSSQNRKSLHLLIMIGILGDDFVVLSLFA